MTLSVALGAEVGSFRLDAAFRAQGRVTALFGASGAGKTVTLRCIAGLHPPTTGRVEIGGRVLFDAREGVDLAPRERRLGYVFQEYALFPHLTVAQNVGYGLAEWPEARRRERVTELLALVGLPELASRRIRGLSGGQQQRVALARSLAPRPDLLLLDEPFSAIDARTRGRLRARLLEIQAATDTPMVLVTHDLPDVRELSDWLVLYDDGRVVREGPTREVLDDPGSDLAAEVLGR